MQDKTELKIDWCSHKAALYACKHWHYSGCIPVGKLVKVGAWENEKYIGCVLFGRGATPHLLKAYGLTQTEGCELVRVAMKEHSTPVTQIIARAIKLLKATNPSMRIIVSFADIDQTHAGIIYQAGNWIYTGISGRGIKTAYIIKGKKIHCRSTTSLGARNTIASVRKMVDPNATEFIAKGKHRYLMPLDKRMRKQIESLRQPYPRPPGVAVNTSSVQDEAGGSNPTGELLTTVELEAV